MAFAKLVRRHACCEPVAQTTEAAADDIYVDKRGVRLKGLGRQATFFGNRKPKDASLHEKTQIRDRLRANNYWPKTSRKGSILKERAVENQFQCVCKYRNVLDTRRGVSPGGRFGSDEPKQALRPFVFGSLPAELRILVWEYYFQGIVVYVSQSEQPAGETSKFDIRHIEAKDPALNIAEVQVRPPNVPDTEPLASFATAERTVDGLGLGKRSCKKDSSKVLQLSSQTRADAGYVLVSRCQHVFSSLLCFAAFVEKASSLNSNWICWIRDVEIFTDFAGKNSAVPAEIVQLLTHCVSLRKASINMFNRAPTFYNLLRLEISRRRPVDAFQMVCHHRNYLMSNPLTLNDLPREQRQAEQMRILQWIRSQGPIAWATHLQEVDRAVYRVGTLETAKGGHRTRIEATIAGLSMIMPISKSGMKVSSKWTT